MEAATKALDQSSHNRPRLSSMSSMKSIGNVSSSSEPDLNGLEGDEKEGALSVPPLPLYALLAADKDTSGSGSATAGIFRHRRYPRRLCHPRIPRHSHHPGLFLTSCNITSKPAIQKPSDKYLGFVLT